MKKLMHVALIVLTSYSIQSCSGVRSNSEPSGPITPAAGSASDLAAGRNTTGTPIADSDPAVTSGAAANSMTGSSDSLSKQVDAVSKENKPEQFITEATLSGLSEVQLSELALKKAQNSYIKAFAAMMVKDHGGANAELKSLAASKNITVGLDHDKAADANQKLTQLAAAAGPDFDNMYIQTMISDHEQAVRLFEEGAKSSDPAVKAYAKKYLPVLKMHLKNISSLNSK